MDPVLLTVSIVMLLIAAVFIYSMFFGAPFLPARKRYIETALDMLALQPGQHLLELGSGDGRVLRAAARRGLRATGYEINPLLYIYSRIATWRYRRLVTIRLQSYWDVELPPAEGVYTFLMAPYMRRLDAKLAREMAGGTKLFSFAFPVPGRTTVSKAPGMYLYEYPALLSTS